MVIFHEHDCWLIDYDCNTLHSIICILVNICFLNKCMWCKKIRLLIEFFYNQHEKLQLCKCGHDLASQFLSSNDCDNLAMKRIVTLTLRRECSWNPHSSLTTSRWLVSWDFHQRTHTTSAPCLVVHDLLYRDAKGEQNDDDAITKASYINWVLLGMLMMLLVVLPQSITCWFF